MILGNGITEAVVGGLSRVALDVALQRVKDAVRRCVAPESGDVLPPGIRAGAAVRRRNTVLLVGLGRSGETQLIQTLVGEAAAPATEPTLRFETTARRIVGGDTLYDLRFIDYRGQDLGQVVATLLQEQASPDPVVRYGGINSLILVVDLFPFIDGEDPDRKFRHYSPERVPEHLGQWNTNALDAVMGLLTAGSLRYACLFVNKLDKWRGAAAQHDAAVAAAKDAYRPLIEQLRARMEGIAEFEVVVGSARTADRVCGVDGIRAKPFMHSVQQPPRNAE